MTGVDDPDHLTRVSVTACRDVAVVLAAGKGTRMRSSLPKVLHRLGGKPLLRHVLDTLEQVGFSHPAVVVGYGADHIRETMGERCDYVVQTEQLGTGDAARVALESLPSEVNRIVVMHGDDPLIEPWALTAMLDLQTRTKSPVVLLTAHVSQTRGLGRVIRSELGQVVALVQESELTPEQQSSHEVNLGAYVFDAGHLRQQLPRLQPHSPKGEYYLTDEIALAASEGPENVVAVTIEAGDEALGVNDLVQLELANRVVYGRKNRRLMEMGVTIIDSASTFIEDEVEIAPDTVVYPFTMISGATRIGRACQIGPSSHILAARIGDRCHIVSSTVHESVIDDDVTVGPYAHLRSGSQIGASAEIGNYAEIKESTVGPASKMHHFSYVGDAQVGASVNIAAGTITCNYDGKMKHRTVIENDAFIASDTLLIAPVTVGEGAATGAGAVVTRDIPAGKLAVGMPARVIKSVPHRESEPISESPERGA